MNKQEINASVVELCVSTIPSEGIVMILKNHKILHMLLSWVMAK